MYARQLTEQWFEDEFAVQTEINFDQFIVTAPSDTLGILIKLRSGGVYVIEEDFDG
jgi:hypothetical protein